VGLGRRGAQGAAVGASRESTPGVEGRRSRSVATSGSDYVATLIRYGNFDPHQSFFVIKLVFFDLHHRRNPGERKWTSH
jgi:hypothetical protein